MEQWLLYCYYLESKDLQFRFYESKQPCGITHQGARAFGMRLEGIHLLNSYKEEKRIFDGQTMLLSYGIDQ